MRACLHLFVVGLSALLVGCAHAPAANPAPPPPKPRIRLAILPVQNEAPPAIAAALDASLQSARPQGIDETFVAKVSREVVQLSIECVEATPACYAATGRSLSANRLLFAVVGKAKHKGLRINVTFFDVDGGVVLGVAERLFPNAKTAVARVGALVQEALGAPAPSAQTSAR